MGSETDGRRRYSGVDADTRRRRRRTQLMRAALEAFGTQGFASSSVKDLCRRAKLTERYFYESFDNREDSLAVLYESLITELSGAVMKAIEEHPNRELESLSRAGLRAFYLYFSEDPRRARVVFHEVYGVSTEMDDRVRSARMRFAKIIESTARVRGLVDEDFDDSRAEVLTMALVGAIVQLASSWSTGHLKADVDALVEETVGMFMGLHAWATGALKR